LDHVLDALFIQIWSHKNMINILFPCLLWKKGLSIHCIG